MPNYGDCALGLPPNWDRTQYENKEWMLMTVGHSNGKSDVYLKDDQEKEHQFYWADPKDKDNRDVMLAYQRGYEFVTKERWEKNPKLWDWAATEHLTFGGLDLMARPKELWLAEQQRRDSLHAKARREVTRDGLDLPAGLIDDDDESRSTARRRGRQPRASASF